MTDFLKDLNPQQKEAVLVNSGSLLVFAGAGSGKTRVITTKIAYAIQQNIVKPYQILAVTFTNKACREMSERVSSMVSQEQASQVFIKTFHSFGVWLLRRWGDRVGLNRNFTIYDDKDCASLLAQCFPNDPKKDIDQAAKKISTLKDKMQSPPKYDERLCRYYQAYNAKLSSTGNIDFADMILKSIVLIRDNPDIAQYIHNRFRMILVDEYQDSNTAQFMLLKLMKGPETFLCVVGDDDQSIYRFRGAKVENILDFPKTFENTKTVVLGRNYRCSGAILDVAKDVINNNGSRASKNLTAEKQKGELPKLYYVNSEYDEAQQVVNILKEIPRSHYSGCAVLYRTNAQSKPFEDRFIMNNIPYHIVGSLKFYDREEIRDAISLISLVANPNDSVAFQRMVNKPARGIGDVSIKNILEKADENLLDPGNVIQACRVALSENTVKGKASEGLGKFIKAYDKIHESLGVKVNSELLNMILSEFGITEYYIKRDKEENSSDSSRVDNLNQLVNMLTSRDFAEGIEGIQAFLEYVALDPSSLASDNGNDTGGVTLITMHNTKGLEFNRVFAVGLEDEIFPSLRDGNTVADLEEERRICYVAFTRAKDYLYMFSAKSRMVWGHTQSETPSRFLDEIDKKHIREIDLTTCETSSWNTYGYYSRQGSGFTGYKGYSKSSYIKPKYSDFNSYDSYEVKKPEEKPKAVLIKKSSASGPGNSTPVKFEIGERVRNDLLGNGTITSLKQWAGRETVVVKFDSGKIGTYLKSKFDFEKI